MDLPTPAPWRVGEYLHQDRTQSNQDALAVWPASVEPGTIGAPICLVSPLGQLNDTDEANARLIAAAPDLLHALIHACKVIRQWHDIGQPDEGRDETVWRIYDQRSPEMKLINQAIEKAFQP